MFIDLYLEELPEISWTLVWIQWPLVGIPTLLNFLAAIRQHKGVV